MAHPAIHEPFSPLGPSPKAKVLLLGAAGPETDLVQRARSLHIEHVSPSALKRGGISRPEDALAPLRRWFFARKPEAGFLLTGFPATLLQARVFDEWLDARGESLDAVHASDGAPAALVAHYRDLGLLAAIPGASVPLEAPPV